MVETLSSCTNSEGNLQLALYKLQIIYQDYNIQMSPEKTNVLAFRGVEMIRPKLYQGVKVLNK